MEGFSKEMQLFAAMAPDMLRSQQRVASGETKLVHYTSAQNAMSIFKNSEFWLRNVKCMNDYSEVEHGISLLVNAFSEDNGARRARFFGIFDRIAPGSAEKAVSAFDSWLPQLPYQVFIGCLSEFDKNDPHGRLSMWRAYTQAGAGVALVMNHEPFLAETDLLGAYSVPVLYLGDGNFTPWLDGVLDLLDQTIEQYAELPPERIEGRIFFWLVLLAVGLKHPAFAEEREWRIISIPNMYPTSVISDHVEAISGIPQIVLKIPLQHNEEVGLHHADIPSLVHKVLIGPSDFPMTLFQAFQQLLRDAGDQKADEKVEVTYIPLRD